MTSKNAVVCQACRRKQPHDARLLRCSQCRQAVYCSGTCQAADWKRGHRKACRAIGALQELQQLTSSISVKDSHAQMQQATEQVELETKKQREKEQSPTKESAQKQTHARNKNHEKVEHPTNSSDGILPENANQVETQPDETPFTVQRRCHTCVRSFYVEHMYHVMAFQATIHLSKSHCLSAPLSADDFAIQLAATPSGDRDVSTSSHLRIHFRNELLFPLSLPRQVAIERASISILETLHDHCLQLRLGYSDVTPGQRPDVHSTWDDLIDKPMDALLEKDVLARLTCASCSSNARPPKEALFQKNIAHVQRLPAGNWEEIADYLTCVEDVGVDWTSIHATMESRSDVVYQDASGFIVPGGSLRRNSICLMLPEKNDPIGTYNSQDDAALRGGVRRWNDRGLIGRDGINLAGLDEPLSDDSTDPQVAQIQCIQCKSILGMMYGEDACKSNLESSTSVARLWQHRLTDPLSSSPLLSPVQWVVRELIRYADAKAIFTMILAVNDPLAKTLTAFSYRRNVLLLRLLTWDTIMSTSFQSSVDDSNHLDWKRAAKVIFEESLDHDQYLVGNNELDNQWMWGGVDLCCPPPKEGTGMEKLNNLVDRIGMKSLQTSTAVRIQISQDDYTSILASLKEASTLVADSVAEATVAIKMGPSSRARLAIVPV